MLLVPWLLCWYLFLCFFSQDGQISADELQRCLTQSGMSGSYKREKFHSFLLPSARFEENI